MSFEWMWTIMHGHNHAVENSGAAARKTQVSQFGLAARVSFELPIYRPREPFKSGHPSKSTQCQRASIGSQGRGLAISLISFNIQHVAGG